MVQGVALELLCRLLFTEGSNPSLSVPLPNFLNGTDRNVSNQIKMDTFIPTVRPFLDIDSRFRISAVPKILEKVGKYYDI